MKKLERPIVLNDLQFSQNLLTSASASFSVRQVEDGLTGGAERGWVDVHWPCYNVPGAYIRGSLPDSHLIFEYMNALADTLISHLGIPSDTPREILFFKAEKCISFRQAGVLDESELTSTIQTTRRYLLP